MIIKSAEFVGSSTNYEKCPAPTLPEYAFIGRSNVGKSSLINMLTNRKGLAKTSTKPGKTQLINHFLINDNWYLVDLPGYGYAKISKKEREKWHIFIESYLTKRTNLISTFVLIDARLAPQKIDLAFMENLGKKNIPFAMVFTKIDKLNSATLNKNLLAYQKTMLQTWESMPPHFTSSAISKFGKDPLLNYIEECNKLFK